METFNPQKKKNYILFTGKKKRQRKKKNSFWWIGKRFFMSFSIQSRTVIINSSNLLTKHIWYSII